MYRNTFLFFLSLWGCVQVSLLGTLATEIPSSQRQRPLPRLEEGNHCQRPGAPGRRSGGTKSTSPILTATHPNATPQAVVGWGTVCDDVVAGRRAGGGAPAPKWARRAKACSQPCTQSIAVLEGE